MEGHYLVNLESSAMNFHMNKARQHIILLWNATFFQTSIFFMVGGSYKDAPVQM